MTRSSTIAAARPRAELFCLTRYPLPHGHADLPVSWEEIDRDARWARGLLADLGVRRPGIAIVVSRPEEVPWACPFERALTALGLAYTGCDAWAFDAPRAATCLRRLPVRAVVGLDAEVVEGLEAIGPLEELLGGVDVLLARPDAHDRLGRSGLRPLFWAPLGPAIAVECAAGAGAHVDPSEWEVEEIDGQLHLTTIGARAHGVERVAVGVRGAVVAGTCACGRDGPRVRLIGDG